MEMEELTFEDLYKRWCVLLGQTYSEEKARDALSRISYSEKLPGDCLVWKEEWGVPSDRDRKNCTIFVEVPQGPYCFGEWPGDVGDPTKFEKIVTTVKKRIDVLAKPIIEKMEHRLARFNDKSGPYCAMQELAKTNPTLREALNDSIDKEWNAIETETIAQIQKLKDKVTQPLCPNCCGIIEARPFAGKYCNRCGQSIM